jgi:hypothetical protein
MKFKVVSWSFLKGKNRDEFLAAFCLLNKYAVKKQNKMTDTACVKSMAYCVCTTFEGGYIFICRPLPFTSSGARILMNGPSRMEDGRTVLPVKSTTDFMLHLCEWFRDVIDLHRLIFPVYRTIESALHTRSGKSGSFWLIHETPLHTDGEGHRTLLVWNNQAVSNIIV